LVKYACIALVAIILLGNFLFSVTRDAPFRNIDPQEEVCRKDRPWTVLAKEGRDGVENDELRAVALGEQWDKKLGCAFQTHIVAGANGPLTYDLAFVEFKENGDPYPLVRPDGQKPTKKELAEKMRKELAEDLENEQKTKFLSFDQLGALTKRLRENNSNFVIVWVHGWRHSARLGDGNVADLRVYAAHAARSLQERCVETGRYCDTKVTAVYVGWRGARVDELKLRHIFETIGDHIGLMVPILALTDVPGRLGNYLSRSAPAAAPTSLYEKSLGLIAAVPTQASLYGRLGEHLGLISALPTLFDRKPVSEQIAPSVLAALRSIDATFPAEPAGRERNRVLVIGHSLGGNLLAKAIKDDLMKRIRRHPARHDVLKPPAGDLMVLINPASEAANWTALQKAVWERIAIRRGGSASWGDEVPTSTVDEDRQFFRSDQPPVVVSVTAALSWPPGGIYPLDCGRAAEEEIQRETSFGADPTNFASYVNYLRDGRTDNLYDKLKEIERVISRGVEYDWATYDLFPAFKGDLRPLAARIDRFGLSLLRRRGQNIDLCQLQNEGRRIDSPLPQALASQLLKGAASILRNFPFMNTDREQTRTIGHLDPPRHVSGALDNDFLSARPFGTTHELTGWGECGVEKTVPYTRVASSVQAACPSARSWLSRARAQEDPARGRYWDSRFLAPESGAKGEGRPAARLAHGFTLAGISAITRGNDPFWNVRAFDNALSRHDGYMLSSFICTMFQLALDDVAAPLLPAAVPAVAGTTESNGGTSPASR
jgi:hypothetical protein